MTIIDQAREAVRDMVFGNLGRDADYRPVDGDAVPGVKVIFKPLGREDTDYGDALHASIDVLREDVPTCPAPGDEFDLSDETPSVWAVTAMRDGESDGQTRFTWSVHCVGSTGKRLNTGRLDRI